VREHPHDFSAEASLVEFERRLALTVEVEIGIQLHRVAPVVDFR
jgi:hypothetical protein